MKYHLHKHIKIVINYGVSKLYIMDHTTKRQTDYKELGHTVHYIRNIIKIELINDIYMYCYLLDNIFSWNV